MPFYYTEFILTPSSWRNGVGIFYLKKDSKKAQKIASCDIIPSLTLSRNQKAPKC